MISKPYPDLAARAKAAFKKLVIANLLCLVVPVLALEAVHHFQISQPSKITAGQEFEIQISVLQSDGSLVESAKGNVSVAVTSSQKTIKAKASIRAGKGVARMTIDAPGLYILQVVDSKNPDLTGSDILKVESAQLERLLKDQR